MKQKLINLLEWTLIKLGWKANIVYVPASETTCSSLSQPSSYMLTDGSILNFSLFRADLEVYVSKPDFDTMYDVILDNTKSRFSRQVADNIAANMDSRIVESFDPASEKLILKFYAYMPDGSTPWVSNS